MVTTEGDSLKILDIINSIFGNVGELVSDYSCAVESSVLLHGKMYITSRYVCFYSNIFGLEKKIRIPFSNVKHITKEFTALVIPNAISIITHRKEYVFRSFWDRDLCFNALCSMIDKNKLLSERLHPLNNFLNVVESQSLHRKPEARRLGLADSDTMTSSGSGQHESRETPSRGGTSADTTVIALSHPDVIRALSSGGGIGSGADVTGDNRSRSRGDDDTTSEYSDNAEAVDVGGFSPRPSDDLALLLSEECKKGPPLGYHVPPATLRMPLNEFCDQFINDDAPNGYSSFHEKLGDGSTGFTTTSWAPIPISAPAPTQQVGVAAVPSSDAAGGDSDSSVVEEESLRGSHMDPDSQPPVSNLIRAIKFIKPLPGMLSTTRCTKLQRLRRFGDAGLVLRSSTVTEDVPAASSFTVEDMLTVTADNRGFVTVKFSYDVVFTQTTIFRYAIESNSRMYHAKWLQAFVLRIKEVVAERSNKSSASASQTIYPVAYSSPVLSGREEKGGATSRVMTAEVSGLSEPHRDGDRDNATAASRWPAVGEPGKLGLSVLDNPLLILFAVILISLVLCSIWTTWLLMRQLRSVTEGFIAHVAHSNSVQAALEKQIKLQTELFENMVNRMSKF